MITTQDDIVSIFNIFHDGSIVEYQSLGDVIILTIEILYLSERIDPKFNSFYLHLRGVENLKFVTWPNIAENEPDCFSDYSEIFKVDLEILSCKFANDTFNIFCNQADSVYDFCGGELSLNVNSAEVLDEAQKEYSIDELSELCSGYWEDWEQKNKKN